MVLDAKFTQIIWILKNQKTGIVLAADSVEQQAIEFTNHALSIQNNKEANPNGFKTFVSTSFANGVQTVEYRIPYEEVRDPDTGIIQRVAISLFTAPPTEEGATSRPGNQEEIESR